MERDNDQMYLLPTQKELAAICWTGKMLYEAAQAQVSLIIQHVKDLSPMDIVPMNAVALEIKAGAASIHLERVISWLRLISSP